MQVDEEVGEALARQVELMVDELHKEEEELEREPPEGQEVSHPLLQSPYTAFYLSFPPHPLSRPDCSTRKPVISTMNVFFCIVS